MSPQEKVDQLKDLLSVAQNIFVIVGPQVTTDQLATASSLALSLTSAGKDVRFAGPHAPSVQREVAGMEQFVTEIGNQNLSISFAYDEQAVDKVSYHIGEQTNRFYLTVKPKKGHAPLSANSVEFSYTGAETDLIFLIGVNQLDQLDQLYFGYEDMYRNSPVVTIGSFEPEFGLIKFDVSGATCHSESITQLLQLLSLPITGDIATNLLAAIEDATDCFRSMSATATTFETVATLMKLGARRMRKPAVGQTAPQITVEEQVMQPTKESRTAEVQVKKMSTKSKKAESPKPGSLKYQPTEGSPRS